uniref:Uncharacterized protein n=1 Tax=Leersia perrieri TaxID=77586 RepID=A0A0D9Y118_9ORYZ
MSSATATATACSSGGLHAAAGGEWLGEISAALQGKWQAMMVSARGGEQRRETRRVAGGVERRKGEGDVGACGGAMSDSTVFLLLDHFAPS